MALSSTAKENSTIVRDIPLHLRALRVGFRTLGPVMPSIASRVALRVFTTPTRYQATERERYALSTAATSFVRLGHHSIAVHSWGSGPAVLLVHGWSGAAAQMTRFVPSLVSAGFRAVALDGLGHGASSVSRSSLLEHAACVAAVAGSLGSVHGVIAHSMGVAASRLAEDRGMRPSRRVYIAGASNVFDVTRRFASALEVPAVVLDEMTARMEARYLVALEALTLVPLVARDETPTLLVHDGRDREVPFREAEALAAAMPSAELLRTEGLGHAKVLRDEAVVAHVVRFVAGPDGAVGDRALGSAA